jgi:hypothetical protein
MIGVEEVKPPVGRFCRRLGRRGLEKVMFQVTAVKTVSSPLLKIVNSLFTC